MPATSLATSVPARDGIAQPAAVAADLVNGNVVDNSQAYSLLLEVTNPGAAAVTITFVTPQDVTGLAIADLTASIPAGATRIFGGFTTAVFSSQLAFTASAALNYRAYRVPTP